MLLKDEEITLFDKDDRVIVKRGIFLGINDQGNAKIHHNDASVEIYNSGRIRPFK